MNEARANPAGGENEENGDSLCLLSRLDRGRRSLGFLILIHRKFGQTLNVSF